MQQLGEDRNLPLFVARQRKQHEVIRLAEEQVVVALTERGMK